MAALGIWDSVLLFSFIKRLVLPFKSWKAYKSGVIDDKGNIVIPKKQRNKKQNDSFKMYDLLVLNLKKLLGKVPGGKSRIATYAAAILLLRESEELDDLSEEVIMEKINGYLLEAKVIMTEDAPTNCASPAVAGLDNNPPNNKKSKIQKRKKLKWENTKNII